MPVQRNGPTPPFYEYVTRRCLLPQHSVNPSTLQQIFGLGISDWIEVPRFQRGISWDALAVEKFLESNSVLLGNVILGQFPSRADMNINVNYYHILVDGLQRFAVGTILLSVLHERVLSPTPTDTYHAPMFARLRALVSTYSIVYEHNDLQLRNHPRNAIMKQYKRLRTEVDQHVSNEFASSRGAQLAARITATFVDRQIALDSYFNFNGPLELMSTFLGINTVRVDLGVVDLVRAYIVEKAVSSNWTPLSVEGIENSFTQVFTSNDKLDSELEPFAGAVLKLLTSHRGDMVLPSWSSTLLVSDVENFLEFVQAIKDFSGNGYFDEIRECGALPFAVVLAYLYRQYLRTGQRPNMRSGQSQEDYGLHRFLIASYRGMLEGGVGRIAHTLEGVLDGSVTKNLGDIADDLSVQFTRITIDSQLDSQWLYTTIGKINGVQKAKRLFNAMMLPQKPNYGHYFAPLTFGRSSLAFNVDHMIPESLTRPGPGADEISTIRNFAPLPSNQNRQAKATTCSAKLAGGGIYDCYISTHTHPPHPYCQWLVQVHASSVSPGDLDRQCLLEPNTAPDIGSIRLRQIVSELLSRI